MYEKLISYINAYATKPLDEEEVKVIKDIFVPKKIRKKQYFLQEGEVCKYMGFIVKGAMRMYSVDDKGMEHVLSLYVEDWWAGDRESFVMLTPTVYNIDAWEDTDILTITQARLAEFNSIPALHEMSRKLDEKHAFANMKRLNASNSLPLEQRYADLAERYPDFLQRFPQHIIASYLGVAKETLSRVRSQTSKK
ncbi:Crp/Fnr family transcriptional regulator [Chitinophaga sp. G-6-1-13]|uniref:Crp/Fnr family transcriptional regulator n=1 Tax=Chitinophaga fulva TaxID=2728842 RepID=A0A848GIY2_9BACT|nr:Crp/Fnr family transcriptional regulator [Chitinophaga fulva]NML38555.1 Crp/Fnr family transcriptional regulator [Chitinophaga fulva]